MALTPDEIVNYPLKQSVRGYSVRQVDALLDEVADQIEETTEELRRARDELEHARLQLSASGETEATLSRTLVTAQRAAEEALADARREAADLIDRAEAEAEQVHAEARHSAEVEAAEARQRADQLEQRVARLTELERVGRDRLRGELQRQLEQLAALDADPDSALTPPPLFDAADSPAVPPADEPAPLRVRVHEPAPWEPDTDTERPGGVEPGPVDEPEPDVEAPDDSTAGGAAPDESTEGRAAPDESRPEPDDGEPSAPTSEPY